MSSMGEDRPTTWIHENGVHFLAQQSSVSQRKSPLYYNKDYSFNRCLVLAILEQYVKSGLAKSNPIKCIDLLGGPGVNGMLWKKHLGSSVEVFINAQESGEVVNQNIRKNDLICVALDKDPCVILHERGYNFVYIDCTVEASMYFDAIFRNTARNGIVVITAKDDSSLHGGTYDVALRRYGGRIVRTHYASELGIRLFLSSLTRSAVKYNKAIKVLCCTVYKSTFTVAVMCLKGPELANKCLNYIRTLKHCMVCEERTFYPPQQGFPIDSQRIELNCKCAEGAPGNTSLQLGPLWSGDIFTVDFIENMVKNTAPRDLKVQQTLIHMLEEARCPSKEESNAGKRIRMDFSSTPCFYYNLHKHHPEISQLGKLKKVISQLQQLGYRASKTHFDPLAVRTDAPLNVLYDVMKKETDPEFL